MCILLSMIAPKQRFKALKAKLGLLVLGPAGDSRHLVYRILRFTWWTSKRAYFIQPVKRAEFQFVIVTMIRDTDRYLVDWLVFHWACGVEHFFVYVNEESKEATSRLSQLLDEHDMHHLVTLIFWPEAPIFVRHGNLSASRFLPTTHEAACMHFWETFRKDTNYYMKLDSDEFFFRRDYEEADLDVKPLLTFEGNLFVWGYNFGSSGIETDSGEPDPCRFVYRQERRVWRKSICHVATTREFFNAHASQPVAGIREPTERPLQINHYRLRSKQEFLRNKMHARGSIGGDYLNVDFQAMDAEYSQVLEHSACHVNSLALQKWASQTA
jgi:hypothetical protein